MLSRKDQVDIKENNKNVKFLKNKLWTRKITIEAEVIIIRRNQTREYEIQNELEKNEEQV